ncbi:hypothetical protein [Archaeoglobus neptunius]|uniref:hypothetical protein n=1 Tax=Archaeoglobus neptunius TaxID=2798580 RepID=UPI001E3716A3|nr:hypothetical protein [Archaeoglobus neptunius]
MRWINFWLSWRDKMTVFMKREVARRVFAKELMSSTYAMRDEGEKSPVYVLTPLGLKCNRVFIIGALTEKTDVGEDSSIYRIRIADQTGSFIGYIGRYQPEAYDAIAEINELSLVAVTAKVRLFEGETRTFVSIRPETISMAEPESRDYWVVETARSTIKRIKEMERGEGENVKLAREIYGTDLNEYRRMVREALLRLKEEYVEETEEEEVELEDVEEEGELDLMLVEEEEIDLTKLLED